MLAIAFGIILGFLGIVAILRMSGSWAAFSARRQLEEDERREAAQAEKIAGAKRAEHRARMRALAVPPSLLSRAVALGIFGAAVGLPILIAMHY